MIGRRNEPRLADLLEDALKRQRAGCDLRATLENMESGAAAEVAPLLAIATQVRASLAVQPSPDAKAATIRLALDRECRAMASRQTRPVFRLHPALVAAGLAVCALGATSAGAVLASEGALPGDALYFIKTVTEEVRLSVSKDRVVRLELNRQMAAARTEEVALLAAGQRPITEEAIERLVAQTTKLALGAAAPDATPTLNEQVVAVMQRQQAVLQEVSAAAPPNAQPALRAALEVSQVSHQAACRAVERSRHHGAQIPNPPTATCDVTLGSHDAEDATAPVTNSLPGAGQPERPQVPANPINPGGAGVEKGGRAAAKAR